MAMYSDKALSSCAQSLEPEIEEHFGFELWLAIGLFLFCRGDGNRRLAFLIRE